MTTSDGGVNSDVQNTAGQSTNDTQTNQNGGNDIQAQFETLKKESAGKDSKISQMLKEKELNNLNNKTVF